MIRLSKESIPLSALEYRLMGKIFVHKEEEVTRNWTKMYIEKLHKTYSTPDIY